MVQIEDDEIQYESMGTHIIDDESRGNRNSAMDNYGSISQLSGNVRASKKVYSNQIGHRYEDQVVPAKREGAMNLEDAIKKYETEMAEMEANPQQVQKSASMATLNEMSQPSG